MNESSIRNRLSERYLLGEERRPDTAMRIGAGQLSKLRPLKKFLNDYEDTVPHARPHEIASRLSYHLMTPVLKAALFLLDHRRYVDLEPQRMVFEKYDNAPAGYEWGMRLTEGLELQSLPNREQTRKRWRRALVERLYGPWFEALSRATRCPKRVLWENLIHVIVGELRARYRDQPGPGLRDPFTADLISLQDEIPGPGSAPAGRGTSSIEEARALLSQPDQYRRTTCCLNYRAGEYCGACPLTRTSGAPGAG